MYNLFKNVASQMTVPSVIGCQLGSGLAAHYVSHTDGLVTVTAGLVASVLIAGARVLSAPQPY